MSDDVTVTQADRDEVEATGLWLSTFEKATLAEAFARHRANHAPQAEPVAWMYERGGARYVFSFRWANAHPDDPFTETPLYTYPPAQDVEALVEALEECVDQLWHLAKDPKSNPLIKQARTALAKFGDKQ